MAGDDTAWMDRAIAVCRRGLADGHAPFGAVLVRDGQFVAEAHNRIRADSDPTGHAEVNLLRAAGAATGSPDLAGTTLYTTCEPCPMCLAAILWAGVGRVVFGASIADAEAAGVGQIPITAATMTALSGRSLALTGGVRRDECARILQDWIAGRRAGH